MSVDIIKASIAETRAAMERAMADFDVDIEHKLAVLKLQLQEEKQKVVFNFTEIQQNLHNQLLAAQEAL